MSHLECHRIWKSNLSVMIRTIKKFYVSNADFCPEALKTVAHLRLEFLGEKKKVEICSANKNVNILFIETLFTSYSRKDKL